MIEGDITKAIYWLINELVNKGETELLAGWDQLRGNDWVLLTKKELEEKGWQVK